MKRFSAFLCALAFAFTAHAAGTANFTSLSSSATTPDLSANPERGWYMHAQPNEWCNGSVASWAGGGNSSFPGQKFALFYYEVNGAANVSAVNANLQCARAAGVKVIFSLSYCSSLNCNEGKSLAQVQADIASYQSVWAANEDVIAFIKITGVGGWGEWASWQGVLPVPANVKSGVITSFMNAAPKRIPLLLRQPAHVQTIYPSVLTFDQWMRNADEQARLGLFNDGAMGGPDDLFTYPGAIDSSVETPPWTTSGTSQRQYAAALSNYAAFIIEPEVGSARRTACTGGTDNAGQAGGIMNEGPRYHWNSAHRAYNAAYHDAWIAGGCFPSVNNLLGYRFQLDSISHATTVTRGNKLRVTVNMRNVGWARIFSQRRLVVTLDNGAGCVLSGTGSVQLRQLVPQATGSTALYVDVAVPTTCNGSATPTGSYSVYASSPDIYTGTAPDGSNQTGLRTAFNIQFANAAATGQVWSNGRFSTNTAVTVN